MYNTRIFDILPNTDIEEKIKKYKKIVEDDNILIKVLCPQYTKEEISIEVLNRFIILEFKELYPKDLMTATDTVFYIGSDSGVDNIHTLLERGVLTIKIPFKQERFNNTIKIEEA